MHAYWVIDVGDMRSKLTKRQGIFRHSVVLRRFGRCQESTELRHPAQEGSGIGQKAGTTRTSHEFTQTRTLPYWKFRVTN